MRMRNVIIFDVIVPLTTVLIQKNKDKANLQMSYIKTEGQKNKRSGTLSQNCVKETTLL